MAEAAVVPAGYFNLLMKTSTDPAPEVFTPFCGITSRGITYQLNGADQFIPDCADPLAVLIRRHVVTGRQWDITGSGFYVASAYALINAAMGVTKMFRYSMGASVGGSEPALYWQGPGKLMQTVLGGSQGDGTFGTISLTLVSDGVWSLVTA